MPVRDLAWRWATSFRLTALALLLASAASLGSSRGEEADSFSQSVKPLLESRCLGCHSASIRKGDLSLSTRQEAVDSGFLVPGAATASHLIDVLRAEHGEPPRMPKEGPPLTDAEIATLAAWIDAGAVWPEGVVLREPSKADASWWSLQPRVVLDPPSHDDAPEGWNDHPIDRFIFAKLREKGLTPNPPATRRELIRRVTYDLTGLAPTPEEVDAFAADTSADAYERLVDRLLASPRYGERWGRHWLDVIRFGESRGFERNEIIDNLWPLRDYVIDAFNRDRPFDQIVREHLAGDVLAPDDAASQIASAFLVAGPYDDVGNQDAIQAAQIRANTIDEIIRTSSEAFIGLTVGCARCHDHKFDPIRQADYYALYATFAGVRHGPRELASQSERDARAAKLAPLEAKRAALTKEREELVARFPEPDERAKSRLSEMDAAIAQANAEIAAIPALPKYWLGTREAAAGPFHVFLGGSPERKGDEAAVSSLGVLDSATAPYRLIAEASEGDRRKAFADWLVQPDHPLTARVLVNRIWHYRFGAGLVPTPSDFGYMGQKPTHPTLLDWLAQRLVDEGWRMKPIHRLIVTSQTYRQSSEWRADAAAADAEASYLWRFPPRRLSAEEVRDSMLAASDAIDQRLGGPGFRLYKYLQDNVATYVPLDEVGRETYRRAVYHQNARAAPVDLMSEFDSPDCSFSTPERAETTTPLQALATLNHDFTLDMAALFAERLQREAPGDANAQVEHAFRLLMNRGPTAEERDACIGFAKEHGLPALGRALFNASEFLYVP
ncbi:MAG TPA: PSD1 and planctomycete cytochrome C domain-containing protein [Pirellulaceae bacterium]|jgi:hypothetical protein|nr:PSD1 and planctomycete cytochrome C domain-containing protein [Pirellulaceae bacterium]